MTEDCKNNSKENLKMLPQEELELRIDCLLAKCRAEAAITKTAEQGAMFRKGPFQISISLAIKMKKYQDELLYCKRNPYDVLLSVCRDNRWGEPVFRAVDYTVGKGFLFSVIVNDHELVSKWRDKRPLLAADLAAANFLRYLGLWVSEKNLDVILEWDQITSDCASTSVSSQNRGIGNLYGYLYFMGFDVVKAEASSDEKTSKSVISLKANVHLQLGKLIYTFLTSRGEKSCWLTEIDIAFYKRLFGELKSDASYILNNESWKSDNVCSCKNKSPYKICFIHEEYFFYFLLKDYFYVDEFGPVDCSVFEKLKEIKKEKEEIMRTESEETMQESKQALLEVGILEKVKEIKKEKVVEVKSEAKEVKPMIENALGRLMHRVKEEKDEQSARNETKEMLKQAEILREGQSLMGPHRMRIPPTSPSTFDPTETPLNLRQKKFDLRSKIFGSPKPENALKEVEGDFKLSFDRKTGISNIKSSVGRWITVDDIRPPCIPLAKPVKRPDSNITTVVTKPAKPVKRPDSNITTVLTKPAKPVKRPGSNIPAVVTTPAKPVKRPASNIPTVVTTPAKPVKRPASNITTVVTTQRKMRKSK